MPPKTIMIALVTGSVAILLGLWSGLDEVVSRLADEIRSMTLLGMMQPAVPTRERRQPTTVTRQERLCFIAFGALLIAASVYAAFFAH